MSPAQGSNPEGDQLKPAEEGLLDAMAFDEQGSGEGPNADSPTLAMAPAPEDAQAEPEEEPPEEKPRRRRKRDRKELGPAEASGPAWLARLREASPYTVMLAVALGALVIGVLILVMELGRYGFRFRP
ncbi:MAG: hypothetical protein ACUVUC_13510 [Thermoguttaceae bacterium]